MRPAAALDSLLRSVGVPGERIPDDLEARRSLLAGTIADRRVFIILDNAFDTEQVLPLLLDTTCRIVITSRRPELRELAEFCGHLPLALAVAAERAGRHPQLSDVVLDLRSRQVRLQTLALDDARAIRGPSSRGPAKYWTRTRRVLPPAQPAVGDRAHR